jgi:proline dehydrogenase
VSLSTSLFRQLILRLAALTPFRWLTVETRLGRAVAGRFVAGERLADAMVVARRLDRERIASMLDLLGENAEGLAQAKTARAAYLAALETISKERSLDCAISVKLTQLGLDESLDVCRANLLPILEVAERGRTLVMVDMESHGYVDATLEVVRAAHERFPRIGVALQSYLRRTERDVFDLPAGMRIRLVKGSYLEPSEVVFEDKRDVDASFRRLFVTLLARGHAIDVATHDPALIEGARRRVDAIDGGWSRVEFQMLYGVRRDLQARLARQGYPVRVYIPYGTEWYPYLTRRLAERPANMWFFLSSVLRGGRRRS